MDTSSLLRVELATAAVMALLYWGLWCWREPTSGPQGGLRSGVKTGSVLFLALAGWQGNAPLLVTTGLFLGAIGDFSLSRPGPRVFLVGMAAFGAGHLAYAAEFLPCLAPLDAGRGIVLVALVCLCVSTEVWLAPHTGALRGPVRLYVVVIGAMGAAAVMHPVPVLRAGAGLFVLSDLLLALTIFLPLHPARKRTLSFLLWPTYWGGQALILWGGSVAANVCLALSSAALID